MPGKETNRNVDLYCVGCGRLVVKDHAGETLAISCVCGALTPILMDSAAGVLAPPASFIRLVVGLSASSGTHWEYYLGYSDHDSDAKRALIEFLTQLGCTSQSDCPEPRCQDAHRGGQAKWKLRTSGDRSVNCAWCDFPIYLTALQSLAIGHDRSAKPLRCMSCHRFTDGYDLSKVPVVVLDEEG